MAQEQFTFGKSFTIENFLKEKGSRKLEVLKSQHGNVYFAWGPNREDIGFVSKKGYSERPIISEVTTPEGVQTYLLHNQTQKSTVLDTVELQ